MNNFVSHLEKLEENFEQSRATIPCQISVFIENPPVRSSCAEGYNGSNIGPLKSNSVAVKLP